MSFVCPAPSFWAAFSASSLVLQLQVSAATPRPHLLAVFPVSCDLDQLREPAGRTDLRQPPAFTSRFGRKWWISLVFKSLVATTFVFKEHFFCLASCCVETYRKCEGGNFPVILFDVALKQQNFPFSVRSACVCDIFDILRNAWEHTRFKRGTSPLTLMDFQAILVSEHVSPLSCGGTDRG